MAPRTPRPPACALFATAVIMTFASTTIAGETNAAPVNHELDASRRAQIVDAVSEVIRERYVDPSAANRMVDYLESRLQSGAYDHLDTRDPFIGKLTADLRSVVDDKHLGVWPIETSLTLEELSNEEQARKQARCRYQNQGIPTARRLQGNIGYLEILDFVGTEHSPRTASAAMEFLSECDALVLDLRRCGGGEGNVGSLLVSYLTAESVPIVYSYTRQTDTVRQSWSLPVVPGKRRPDVPVYVLQSRRTASAAECVSYALQSLERARIVGETSRGAANPVDEVNFPELGICVAVSISRVWHPATGRSWEGGGVAPDLMVPAELALAAACRDAASRLLDRETDPDLRLRRRWAFEFYEAQVRPTGLSDNELDEFCGSYNRSVTVDREGLALTLEWPAGESRCTLLPLGDDRFALLEREARIAFERTEDGQIETLNLIYADGYTYTFARLR